MFMVVVFKELVLMFGMCFVFNYVYLGVLF